MSREPLPWGLLSAYLLEPPHVVKHERDIK